MCPLCKQAGRPYPHYLSKCPYLPEADRQYLARSRQIQSTESELAQNDPIPDPEEIQAVVHQYRIKSSTQRVSIKQSPYLKAFYEHHPLHLTLDTGAETSMMKTSVATRIGATIMKTKQQALQADGFTRLSVVGEVRLVLSRGHLELQLDALVVDNLDVDILAGTPFMITNDISVRPSQHQVTIHGTDFAYYGEAPTESPTSNIRRAHAHVLRAPPTTTVVWPGQYLELDLPDEIAPDTTLAIEPRVNGSKLSGEWPHPHITQAVAHQIRILNDTGEPKRVPRHDHLCQVFSTTTYALTNPCSAPPKP